MDSLSASCIILFVMGMGTSGFLLSPNTTIAPCVDLDSACSHFNICVLDPDTAKRVCRKYCNLCDIVDGAWSVWGTWGTCSVTCDNGTRIRNRTCDNPPPAHGGDDCQGPSQETSECLMNKCPVHGGWSGWNEWGTCSSSCGIGLRRRDRACDSPWPSPDGNHCFGDSVDQDICMEFQCPVGWTPWSDWGTCSSTCGTGAQRRTRYCQNTQASSLNNNCDGESSEYRTCVEVQCSIGWTLWSAWDACSLTCGTGVQQRSRDCHNPLASALSNSCAGNNIDFRTCSSYTCNSLFLASGIAIINETNSIRFPYLQYNEGNDYNLATGVFTCRIPGTYWFSASLSKGSGFNEYIDCNILVNRSSKILLFFSLNSDNHYSDYLVSVSGGFHLIKGDRVSVGSCIHPENIYNSYNTHFSGVLIRPDA